MSFRRPGRGHARQIAAAGLGAMGLAVATAPGATAAVQTDFTAPPATAAGHPDSTKLAVSDLRVTGPHPDGVPYLEAYLSGTLDGRMQADAPAVTAGDGDTAPAAVTLGGLVPWRRYDVSPCFRSTAFGNATTECTATRSILSGYITSTDATGLYGTYVTLNGLPSAPYPAGALGFYLGRTNPAGQDPLTVLDRVGGFAVPARTDATLGDPYYGQVTNLTKGTTYWWTTCFDNPAAAGVEACAPVRDFTTGTYDPPGTGSNPLPTPTTPTTPTVPTKPTTPKDTKKPTVKLALAGKAVRGGRLRLTVTATDAGGIGRVRVKVGSAPAQAVRHKTIVLPKRKGTVKLLVTVTDKAGNVTTVRRTITVK